MRAPADCAISGGSSVAALRSMNGAAKALVVDLASPDLGLGELKVRAVATLFTDEIVGGHSNAKRDISASRPASPNWALKRRPSCNSPLPRRWY